MKKNEAGMPVLYSDERGPAIKVHGELLRLDLSRTVRRVSGGGSRAELVVKACRIKGRTEGLLIIDATAGFGEDSFMLAAAGAEVMMYEREPLIAALLRDALCRASQIHVLADASRRMTLTEGDSIEAMRTLKTAVDVIYLDPMFPKRRKSSLVKKKLQVIQMIEKPCENEALLLDAAKAAGPKKIVIKRPVRGAFMAGEKPTYSIHGKTVRFDCIVL